MMPLTATKAKCEECNRIFDLTTEIDAEEYLFGHDCEPTKTVECPNHDGNFDCTPFCALCGGEQEYTPSNGAN